MNYFDIITRFVLIILSGMGLVICSRYAFPAWYKQRGFPEPDVAKKRDGSLISLSTSAHSRLLKFPVWYWGVAFYLLTITAMLYPNVNLVFFALLACTGAALVSSYLTLYLTYKLQARCRICQIAQTVNAAMLVTWAVIIWKG